jgi:hypothetical protein
VRIKAERDGELRLRDPFGGATAVWSRSDIRREGGDWVLELRAGEMLEGTREKALQPS